MEASQATQALQTLLAPLLAPKSAFDLYIEAFHRDTPEGKKSLNHSRCREWLWLCLRYGYGVIDVNLLTGICSSVLNKEQAPVPFELLTSARLCDNAYARPWLFIFAWARLLAPGRTC